MQFHHIMADSLPPGSRPGTFNANAVSGLSCPEQMDLSPTRFDGQIKDFLAADRDQHIDHVPTVFFGSSTVANWTDIPDVFQNLGAINRGMGGSTIPDQTYALEDSVLKHTPDRVVLYTMTNDMASGHLPETTFNDFVKLEHQIHGTGGEPKLPGANPDIKLYVVGPMPAPCREVLDDKYHMYQQANEMLKNYAQHTPNVFYIDPSEAVDDKTGHLDPNKFGPDHLHPKPEFYTTLASVIQHEIKADESADHL
jgi:hypothetical protein